MKKDRKGSEEKEKKLEARRTEGWKIFGRKAH
jgi:hypothetical protein